MAKKCRVCKSKFEPFNSMQVVCGPKCAADYAREQRQKEWDKETRRRKKELRENDRRWQLKELQKEFNEFIRLRDADKPCICCGKWTDDGDLITGSRWDAGHYRSIGANPELRFNEDNCHKQLVKCNRDLSGNVVNYRINLIKRIGLARVEALEANHPPKKYTLDEIKEMRKEYRAKIRELKRQQAA